MKQCTLITSSVWLCLLCIPSQAFELGAIRGNQDFQNLLGQISLSTIRATTTGTETTNPFSGSSSESDSFPPPNGILSSDEEGDDSIEVAGESTTELILVSVDGTQFTISETQFESFLCLLNPEEAEALRNSFEKSMNEEEAILETDLTSETLAFLLQNLQDQADSNTFEDEVLPPLNELFHQFGEMGVDEVDFQKINQCIHSIKNNDLVKLVRYVYFAKNYWINTPCKEGSATGMTMRKPDDPHPLEYFSPLLREFLVNINLSSKSPQPFSADNQYVMGAIFPTRSMVGDVELEGPLEEILGYNAELDAVLANFVNSLVDYKNSLARLCNQIKKSNLSLKEMEDILGSKKYQNFAGLEVTVCSAIQTLTAMEKQLRQTHPSLLYAYLSFENCYLLISEMNRPFEIKPGSRMSKSRLNERREDMKKKARYFSVGLSEMFMELLTPFANDFLSILGEAPRTAIQFVEDLKVKVQEQSTIVQNANNPKIAPPKQKVAQKQVLSKKDVQAMPVLENKPMRAKTNKKPVTTPISNGETTSTKVDPAMPEYIPSPFNPEVKEVRKWEKKVKVSNYKLSDEVRNERKKIAAQKLAEKYKEERKEQKKKVRLRFALNRDEAGKLIADLSTSQKNILEHLFLSSHLRLSHMHVIHLAKAIQDRMDVIFGTSNGLFLKAVKDKIHVAHDSKDTGDRLPSHYVDILRMVFIIYGVIPEDWKPQTQEDFEALQYL